MSNPYVRVLIRTGEVDELVLERAAKLGWNPDSGTRVERVGIDPPLPSRDPKELIERIILDESIPAEAIAELHDRIVRANIEKGHYDGAVRRRAEKLGLELPVAGSFHRLAAGIPDEPRAN